MSDKNVLSFIKYLYIKTNYEKVFIINIYMTHQFNNELFGAP